MGPRPRDLREMWLAMAWRVSTSGTVIFRTIPPCSVQGVASTTGNAISIATARATLCGADTALLFFSPGPDGVTLQTTDSSIRGTEAWGVTDTAVSTATARAVSCGADTALLPFTAIPEGAVILAITRDITDITPGTDFILVGVFRVMGPFVRELLAQLECFFVKTVRGRER